MRRGGKASVLAPIGTSPPVITEFVQYLEEGVGERIEDLVLISTSDPYVRSCADLAEQAIADRYPHIRVHRLELGFEDLDSEERVREFMLKMAELLRDRARERGAGGIYINSAGGRKDSLIALSILAQLFPVKGVFHVVMPEVKAFSAELERAKREIEELGEAEDKRAYYLAHKSLFDPLMYPDRSRYSVVKIPILPQPWNWLKALSKALGKGGIPAAKSGLDPDHIIRLAMAGILQYDGKRIYPTEDGKFFAEILRVALG